MFLILFTLAFVFFVLCCKSCLKLFYKLKYQHAVPLPSGQHPLIGSCLNLSHLLFESQSLTFSMTSGVESAN